MLSIGQINAMRLDEACDALAGVIENSPWVVRAAMQQRPFDSFEQLHKAMMAVIANASADRRLDLLRAHPELAGSSVPVAEMTENSKSEQGTAGLDALPAAERAAFDLLNRTYREKFTFPFIIAVREHDRASILTEFQRRLDNSADVEMAMALAEVAKVSRARLRRISDGD